MWMSPGRRPSHGTFPESCPAASNKPPTITIASPTPTRIFPSSLTADAPIVRAPRDVSSQRQLGLAPWRQGNSGAEVRVCGRRRPASVRRPDDVADLQQEGLDHFREGLRFIVDGRGDRLESDRAAAVLFDDRHEEAAVEAVETGCIHALHTEGVDSGSCRSDPVAPDLAVVADATQQPVGDPRGAARPARDGLGARRLDGGPEDRSRAHDDRGEILDRVEIEMVEDAEALSEW